VRLTSQWEPNQMEQDYYLLPTLPATPPGDYHLQIVVYDPETMERLLIQTDDGSVLGDNFAAATLRIERSASPQVVEPTYEVPSGQLTSDLSLLGYDLPQRSSNPGDRVELALYWKALRDIGQDYVVRLLLTDNSGSSLAQERSRPAYDTYPFNLWRKGETIRDWHELRIPAEAPGGEYHLQLILEREGHTLAERTLGTIRVSGRARYYEIPPTQHELGWRLGEQVELLGYDLESHVRAGDALHLILYWQCLSEVPKSYTVFTHVLDSESMIRGQLDRVPGVPEAPTTSWVQGEVIADTYEIPLDPDAPPGEYLVEIGMYDPTTMERLPVFDARGEQQGNSILLKTVNVAR
jgi:hypothetical protein